MTWPPVTHQDVQDEVSMMRLGFRDYLRSGYYSSGLFGSTSTSATALTSGFAYVRPFLVYSRRSFDRIGVNVSTAATTGGLISLGLYEPGLSLPGALILETATVSSETTGPKEFVINVTLDPGIHWVGIRLAGANCSVPGWLGTSSPYSSSTTTVPSNATSFGAQQVSATAFPNPWPTVAISGGSTPLVALRAT